MNVFNVVFASNILSFDNVLWGDVYKATLETLHMTVVSTIYVFVIGLVLGILLYVTDENHAWENKFVHGALSFVVDIFRSIPFVILIVLLIPVTKVLVGTMLGPKGAIPALIISAAPFYARLVSIALNEIPVGVVEAAESMGATTLKIIWKVLIPEALPALISGITVTAIALIGATAAAGVIGSGGLGTLAYLIGYTRNKQDIVLVATVMILILVFVIQLMGDYFTKRVDKR
ncbi:D-methionine transport system permease protein [Granulicatella balaenopterae]|uniref:D-methionine transport system permease protein n=1 Tax=Granulicatella balaenopterae TaxID=137733 RepID=A0A1H9I5A1_9LACT|nr:methionine ABC transporter permease [Granulicatella balaenopterae]SEQ69615.1 D-methionine transport system permease protein [Granulicatella balaenopterae]